MRATMHDLGLLLLRLGTGLTLVAHGYPKLFGGEGKQAPNVMARALGTNYPGAVERGGARAFSEGLARMQVPMPRVAAYLAGLAEFGGGLALALGFFTRLTAPIVILNMGVAIRKAHWRTGFYGQGGFELAFMLALGAATLLFTGPGAFSVDETLLRRRHRLLPWRRKSRYEEAAEAVGQRVPLLSGRS